MRLLAIFPQRGWPRSRLGLVLSFCCLLLHHQPGWGAVPGPAVNGLQLEMLTPDRMHSDYSVGDLFDDSRLSNALLRVQTGEWPARLRGVMTPPTHSDVRPSVQYALAVRKTKNASGEVVVEKLSLSAGVEGTNDGVLSVTLSNARTHTLTLDAAKADYIPRFRYWNKDPNYATGDFLITELVTADEVAFSLSGGRGTTADLDLVWRKIKGNMNGVHYERTATSAKAIGKSIAVAYKTWRAQRRDKDEIGFTDRVVAEGDIFLEQLKHAKGPLDISNDNDFGGSATVVADANKLYLSVTATILSQKGNPKSFYDIAGSQGGARRTEIPFLAYLGGTRLSINPLAHSRLKGAEYHGGGQHATFEPPEHVEGNLVKKWVFDRWSKQHHVNLSPFTVDVSIKQETLAKLGGK